MLQISSGSVLSEPDVCSDRENSSYESVKPKSATATMPGARIGTTTSRMICHRLAPRSRAASSHAWSKRESTANITSTPKGSVHERCAPSAELYQAASIPRYWNSRPMPMPSTSPGTTRLPIIR